MRKTDVKMVGKRVVKSAPVKRVKNPLFYGAFWQVGKEDLRQREQSCWRNFFQH